jgi:colanic acid biosynthesis glycosyl transferase WcaI
MKILVSSMFFHPDHSGIALYSTDLAAYFAEQGHDVTMVTGFPFYPVWEKRPEDNRKLFSTDEYKGVKALRGYLYVPKSASTFRRMLHEASFTLFAFLNFLRAGRPDCIIVISPPLLLGLVGVAFKFLWKSQLVIHIQDLQPDAAVSLGMVKQGLLVTLLLKLEALIYKHASWVATITGAMRKNLIQKGVPEEKVALYPNWIDVAEVSKNKRQIPRGKFLSKYPVAQGKFTVAYAGNIGVKQGVEVLVRLAEASRAYKHIHYFIIGEGTRRAQLEEYAKNKALTNITLLPFMSQEHYFEMLQDIDVSFVSQKSRTGDIFFPSKLLGIMAMRKPLLVSADLDSELSTVISSAGCGLVSVPDDLNSLLKNLVSLYENPSLRQALARNGYEHVKHYDREQVLSGFLARVSQRSDRSFSDQSML